MCLQQCPRGAAASAMVSAGQFHVELDPPLKDGPGDASTLVMLVLDDDDADEASIHTLVGGQHGHTTTHAQINASAGVDQEFPLAPSKRARQHPPPLVHAAAHCALADGCPELGGHGATTTAATTINAAARSATKLPVPRPEPPCIESQRRMPTLLLAERGASAAPGNNSSQRAMILMLSAALRCRTCRGYCS